MVRLVPTSLALAILIATTTAFAQSPPPAPPASAPAAPPPAPPPANAPPSSAPPGVAPPGDTPPVAPPGYAPPGYYPAPGAPVYPPPSYPPPGYNPYAPPPPPPPPEAPPKPLRWSLRYDPFDLLERRLTFEGEVALYKFLALEVVPSWIFGSPYSGIDGKGFAISGRAVFYLSGEAFRGLWLKASFGYENYSATFTNPGDPTDVTTPQRLASGIIGVLFGDTWVIPRAGGFALSGGIGLAIATANKVTLTTNGSSIAPAAQTTLYDGFDKVRPLGTVGVGVAF